MQSKLRPVILDQLGLGLFTDVNPYEVPVGGCVSCRNVVWTDGYLRPRPGFTQAFGYSPRRVHHINRFLADDGNTYLAMLDISGNDLRFLLNDSASWVFHGTLTGDGHVSLFPTSCSWKQQFWFTTGLGAAYNYNTADGVETIASMNLTTSEKIFFNPQIIVAGSARLFIADCYNTTDNSGERVPYRVAWSDFNDGTTWGIHAGKTCGYVDLVDSGSDPVTAMFYSGTTLMVFKPNAIHMGTPAAAPKVFEFRQRTTGIGCVSHRTLRRYRDGWHIWLGDDNVYRGGVDREIEAIGDRIVPRIRAIVDLVNIGKAQAVIDVVNHLYTLYLPSVEDSKVYIMFTLNLKNGSWWEGRIGIANVNVTDTLEFRPNPWERRCLVASESGVIYETSFSFTTDQSVPITTSWLSGALSSQKVTQGQVEQVVPQVMRIYAADGTARLGMWVGDNLDRMTYTDFGLQTCDGVQDVVLSETPYSGENVQVQITNDNGATAAKVSKLAFSSIPLEGKTRR